MVRIWRTEVEPEELAKLFIETYAELATGLGYMTQESMMVRWENMPEPNKSLLIAVAEKVLLKLER